MLTGDENIVDIDFVVRWQISSGADGAANFLFNTRNPESTIRSAAESVMREVIGRTPIQPALTEARGADRDAGAAGHPGDPRPVPRRRADPAGAAPGGQPPARGGRGLPRRAARQRRRAARQRNEAEAYRNDIIPRARGEAERMIQEAQGFRDSQEARARGEAQRFTAVLEAYQLAQDVTMRRIYLETMEEILRRNPKVIIDDRRAGAGALPAAQRPEPAVGLAGPPRPARRATVAPALPAVRSGTGLPR